MMQTSQIGKNIVLAGRQFQPLLLGEYWLVKNGIISESSISGSKISTEMMSAVSTSSVELVVISDKFTIGAKPTTLDSDLAEICKKLIEKLPDPSYIGIGINSQWNIFQSTADAAKFQESLKPSISIPDYLKKNDATWGSVSYTSSIGGSILRLQIVPIFPDSDARKTPTQFVADFNFHFYLGESEPQKEALAAIDRLDSVLALAGQIAGFFSESK